MKSRAAARISSTREQALDRGRESFRKQAWGDAFSQLSAADGDEPLEAGYLVELAQAALLIGRETEGVDALTRAHQGFISQGETRPAVRCAFWLGFTALFNGEFAKAGGWLSRAHRLLEGHAECVEMGYLLLPDAFRSFREGDAQAAYAGFVQAAAFGERFHDKDLVTLGLQGQGRALIRQGEVARGLALLDEAMVAVTAGEVSALNAGGVYCSVLDACGEIFDLRRAHEWTAALERWCASQTDLVPYRGHCLVRRSELLQFHGEWPNALDEAQRAAESLSHPPPKPFVAAAFYQVGEVHRLRGDFAAAEEAYQQASRWNSSPGPGLALLRLAQGQVDAAHAAIRHMAAEVRVLAPRARVLDAYVEIALAAKDTQAARSASDELTALASLHDMPFLRGLATRAGGAVLLAEGDPGSALVEFRQSLSTWSDLQAPYEVARVRALTAKACQEIGDEATALAELTAARDVFQQLGAVLDLSRAEELLTKDARQTKSVLTERELQVLRLVAAGMTNRGIAGKLFISEKTVARHMSNIFTKLNVYSRSAATAYAYNHELV